jgi:hypothetical protein
MAYAIPAVFQSLNYDRPGRPVSRVRRLVDLILEMLLHERRRHLSIFLESKSTHHTLSTLDPESKSRDRLPRIPSLVLLDGRSILHTQQMMRRNAAPDKIAPTRELLKAALSYSQRKAQTAVMLYELYIAYASTSHYTSRTVAVWENL